MEGLAIFGSIPVCFIAAIIGTKLIRNIIKRFSIAPTIVKVLRLFALIIITTSANNLLATFIIGPCNIWHSWGDVYRILSEIIFLLTPPSLVLLLATSNNGQLSTLRAVRLASIVTPLCFVLAIENLERTSRLYGIDFMESTDKACRAKPWDKE